MYESLVYLPFINLNLIYDNSRLLDELGDDLPHLPKFTQYVSQMLRVITPERVLPNAAQDSGT